VRWLAPLLAAALGIAVVVLGGADDSPGLQGIGVVIVAGAAILFAQAVRRRTRKTTWQRQ
jgi:drug/metabolite transporter (DMT)-like permease